MKRVKAINGYTIYEMTARDEKNGDGIEGEFSIYFSSDVRDYGVAYATPEYEGLETLEIAIEMISDDDSRLFAQAREELEEEYTAVSYEDIEERVNEIKAQEGEAMNETTNATESMTYFEARETYAELFKKYPEVSGVFTDNEGEKRIIYWCENYEKHGSRWELVDITEERINYVFYYNVVDPRASRFMRNLGGYERTTVNYTKRGYIPTECVSISPDRTAKTVRRFEFI